MKKLIMVAVMVAGVTYGQDAVKVEPTSGGAIVAVDIAGGPGRTARAWQAVKNNKWKIIGTAAGLIAVDRVADNNDWLWHERDAKPKAKAPEPEAADPKPAAGSTSQTAGGDATQTIYNADNGSTIIINIGAAE
jgi:hypothetical protein